MTAALFCLLITVYCLLFSLQLCHFFVLRMLPAFLAILLQHQFIWCISLIFLSDVIPPFAFLTFKKQKSALCLFSHKPELRSGNPKHEIRSSKQTRMTKIQNLKLLQDYFTR